MASQYDLHGGRIVHTAPQPRSCGAWLHTSAASSTVGSPPWRAWPTAARPGCRLKHEMLVSLSWKSVDQASDQANQRTMRSMAIGDQHAGNRATRAFLRLLRTARSLQTPVSTLGRGRAPLQKRATLYFILYTLYANARRFRATASTLGTCGPGCWGRWPARSEHVEYTFYYFILHTSYLGRWPAR